MFSEGIFTKLPYGLAVRIPGFHPGGPGSTPGMGTFFFFFFFAALLFYYTALKACTIGYGTKALVYILYIAIYEHVIYGVKGTLLLELRKLIIHVNRIFLTF